MSERTSIEIRASAIKMEMVGFGDEQTNGVIRNFVWSSEMGVEAAANSAGGWANWGNSGTLEELRQN